MTVLPDPPVFAGTPMAQITPFTYREGATLMYIIERLKRWSVELGPSVQVVLDKALEELTEYVDDAKNFWENKFDDFMANVVKELEKLNDQSVANLIRDSLSQTSIALVESYKYYGNVKRYGAKGDGVTDDLPAIKRALANEKVLFFPSGTYMVSGEIRIGSGQSIMGESMDGSIIKMVSGADQKLNVITTTNNVGFEHTNYVYGNVVRDITVDSNGYNRPQGNWNNSSGVKLVTAERFLIENVRSINGPMHCFDIMASVYQDDTVSNVNTIVPGPSRYGRMVNCHAYNPVNDDGITTHGSHDIVIRDCFSINNRPSIQSNQNGIEIDEGSYRITVDGCYSEGWAVGYQIKGHETTTPAHSVKLVNCVAKSNNHSYRFQHLPAANIPAGQFATARNITVENCMSLNTVLRTPTYTNLAAMEIRHYSNVSVRNFTAEGGVHNHLIIMGGGDNVEIDGWYAKDVWTSPYSGNRAYIYVYADFTEHVRLRNIQVTNAIGTPLIWVSAGGAALEVDGIKAIAKSGASFPAVQRAHIALRESHRAYDVTGFACDLRVVNETSEYQGDYNNILIEPSQLGFITGPASPEGVATSWGGVIYVNKGAYDPVLWVRSKKDGVGNTNWKALATLADIPPAQPEVP